MNMTGLFHYTESNEINLLVKSYTTIWLIQYLWLFNLLEAVWSKQLPQQLESVEMLYPEPNTNLTSLSESLRVG